MKTATVLSPKFPVLFITRVMKSIPKLTKSICHLSLFSSHLLIITKDYIILVTFMIFLLLLCSHRKRYGFLNNISQAKIYDCETTARHLLITKRTIISLTSPTFEAAMRFEQENDFRKTTTMKIAFN